MNPAAGRRRLVTSVFVGTAPATGSSFAGRDPHRLLEDVRDLAPSYGGRAAFFDDDDAAVGSNTWLLVLFASPRQAVAFALAGQRTTGGTAIAVRIGIDTTDVDEVEVDGAGLGPSSHGGIAKRIAERALAGEVLVSDVVRQLVGSHPLARFDDRGRRRLRGQSERWHLWAAEDAAKQAAPRATVGRVAELAALGDLLTRIGAGAGGVVLLEGEAGIGKTHLIRDCVVAARRTGVVVIELQSDEVSRRLAAGSHAVLAAASMPAASASFGRPELRSRLSPLLDSSASAASNEDLSFGIVEATIDLLEAMAGVHPVLIAAEDMHWGDDLTLSLLQAVARRARVSRFGLVATCRPSPRPRGLDRLIDAVHDGAGSHVRIGSLDDLDVQALASIITGGAPGNTLRSRLRATAGNPLFITELLRFLDDGGHLRMGAGIAEVPDDIPSANLHETLVRRLSWLPPETSELLRLASLLGGTFTLRDVAVITGRPLVEVARWLREASVAGLVIGDGEALAFRHDLIREAVYGNMLAAERRDLHRGAAHALAAAGAPTHQVAGQYARGAVSGDLEAVAWLERAGVEAISVSPVTAVALFEQAVALAPPNWTGRAALQSRLIEVLAWCGRFADAEAVADEVLRSSDDPTVEFAVLRGLSAVLGNRGNIPAAISALHRTAASPAAPEEERRRMVCLAAQLAMLTGTMPSAATRVIAEETRAFAAQHDDASTMCLALQTLGVVASVEGYAVQARDHAAGALALFDSGRVAHASYLVPDTFHAFACVELDAIAEASAAADRARMRAENRGALALVPGAYVVGGFARMYGGSWDEAQAVLEAGLAVIDDTGSHNFVVYHHAGLARIALGRGDLAAAAAHLDAAEGSLVRGDAVFGADWLLHQRARYLEAVGDTTASLAMAEMAWGLTAHIRFFYGYRQHGVFLVRQAVLCGRTDLAESVAADLDEGARRTTTASSTGAALWVRGLVGHDPDLLLDAVRQHRLAPVPADLAECCEDTATQLVLVGRRPEAIALLREANECYQRLPAEGAVARTERAMYKLGVRQAPRRARPTSGWESLTEMEVKVSRFVVQGLTNPEIGVRLYISRRTVETHLSHVFAKLGLVGRTQLAAEIARRATETTQPKDTP